MSIISGYMVPHPPLAVSEVGRGEEKAVQATLDSFDAVARDIAAMAPETIIISSPHTVMYSDYFHICPGDSASGDFGDFRAPAVSFQLEYDTELRDLLCQKCEEKNFPAGRSGVRSPRLDHGVMVPLYFVNKYYKNYKLLRLGLSGLSLTEHYKLGILIAESVEETGRKAAFIASGDLSHCQKEDGPYGYRPEGPSYDEHIMDVMRKGAFGELFYFDENELEKAEECGHRSFVIMAGAFDKKSLDIRPLSHEATFGVGYGFCIYTVTGDDGNRAFLDRYLKEEADKLQEEREKEDPYVRLARASVESWVRDGKVIDIPENLPADMLSKEAGTFVSIHEHGRLRGCIGTISATRPSIASEIIGNAISASTKDPRFAPIGKDELPYLTITVDVLGETEPIPDKSFLDTKRYGVIVNKGSRRGLLLPNLEGIDSVDEQIAIARQKAGIRPDEKIELERFEVVRHY